MAFSASTSEMKNPMECPKSVTRSAAHFSSVQRVTESVPKTYQGKTGVAFSGGGVRSAAFCSGVLRRLLQTKVEPDYLSCVSGGGYTGTAYLDWKYRHEKKDDPGWHREFFERMRSRAGYICNWQKLWEGSLDTLIISILIFFVVICVPIFGWGSFACPLAFVIDSAFGDVLRAKRYWCSETINANENCQFKKYSDPYDRMLLFIIPLGSFIFFHLLEARTTMCKGLVNFLQFLSGSLFTFTFLPWFINDYLDHTPIWVQIGVVVISAVVWFFLPVLRRYSSLVILVYTFSYVVYWHVYDKSLVWIQHTEERFLGLLFASGLILGIASVFGEFQLRLVHIYNRWRLQKAFYTEESVGTCGCSGIRCYDCFPGTHLCGPPARQAADDSARALSLCHLKEVKPEYISNIVVNGWRKDNKSKPKFRLMTMTPNEFDVIDYQPQEVNDNLALSVEESHNAEESSELTRRVKVSVFGTKLEPGDIKLSSAMAMSAAALSPHLGAFEQEEQAYTHILTVLGLEMASSIVYDIAGERTEAFWKKVLHYTIKGIFILLLIIFPIIYFSDIHKDSMWVTIGIGAPFAVLVIISFPVLCNTGNPDGDCVSRCSRWLIVHVPFCRFMRSIFNVINTGPVPPAMLHLSDGGHFENLAILPLLKRRLGKILIVNGGYIESDSCYGDDLVNALELAREMLNCSFTAMDGDDVLADIKEKFVKKREQQPRKYEFKVNYYEKTSEESERRKVGEGHVVLISPRHPSKGLTREDETWQDLESGLWGPGPVLNSTDVDPLTCCCCECCHNQCCGWISKKMCGVFPHHYTGNQFFTPVMFSAYHREGYRACMEAMG